MIKKIFLNHLIFFLVLGAVPVALAETRVCIGANDAVIEITLPGNLFGVDLDAAFGQACTDNGGTVRGIAPKYIPPGNTGGPIRNANQVLEILVWILTFFQYVFWIFAVGFGLYSAYLFLFSGGSAEGVTRARRMLIYAVVASAVAVLAYGLPSLIAKFITDAGS